jgi:hypothetical protein
MDHFAGLARCLDQGLSAFVTTGFRMHSCLMLIFETEPAGKGPPLVGSASQSAKGTFRSTLCAT